MGQSREPVHVTAYEVQSDGSTKEIHLIVEPPSMFTMRKLVKGGLWKELRELQRRQAALLSEMKDADTSDSEAAERLEDRAMELGYDSMHWTIRTFAVLLAQADPKHGNEEWLGRVICPSDLQGIKNAVDALLVGRSEENQGQGEHPLPNAASPSPTR